MSTEETAPDGAETRKKGLPPFVMPIVLVVAGLGGGGYLGAKVVGPRLVAGFSGGLTAAELAAHTPTKKAHAEGEAGADDEEATDEDAAAEPEAKGEGEHALTAPPLYTLSDLVLNPAGSGGTRFLMLSVAFDMKDSAAVEVLKQRDAEIKDAVLALVGAKTVEELAEVTTREPLKAEIRTLVGKITKKPKAIKRVSFPQFVIQ